MIMRDYSTLHAIYSIDFLYFTVTVVSSIMRIGYPLKMNVEQSYSGILYYCHLSLYLEIFVALI